MKPVSYTHLDVYKRQAYEYLCSVFTEIVFGAVFWDYSALPFNLGGRINPVSYTHLDVYKRQAIYQLAELLCLPEHPL